MPAYIKRLTSNGLEDVGYSANSLKEAVEYEPNDGIYTVTNTFNQTQTLMFDAHLDRLEDSARRENIPLKLDRDKLKQALRQMILDSGYANVKFRVTVPHQTPDEIILTMEPFSPLSSSFIAQGTRCITSNKGARHNPAAKTMDWIHDRKALEDAMPEGIYDTFLVNPDGYLLEGLASNFYAILDGELRTAGEGVLAGISRKIVFAVCEGIIPLRTDAVSVADIPNFSEAFLTSSSRGIVPVIEIDGIVIGDGEPGEKTMALRTAYDAWMNTRLEEL